LKERRMRIGRRKIRIGIVGERRKRSGRGEN